MLHSKRIAVKLILKPDKWVQGGLTIAYPADPSPSASEPTAPVFVQGAIPGETVEVEIMRERSGHRFAVVRRVLEESPERIPSSCPVFPDCGGCSFRHIPYEAELSLKRSLLGEMRNLRPHLSNLEVFSASPDGYRHTARMHRQGKDIGFYALWTERLIPLPEQGCLHLAPEINTAIRQDHSGASFFLNRNGDVFTNRNSTEIELTIGHLSWAYRPGMFFQANRFLIRPWLEWMKNALDRERNGTNQFRCLELFCGTGLIGGFLSDRLTAYTGIESEHSLRQAEKNFQRHRLSGRFRKADLYHQPAKLGLAELPADLWIVNPPRAGLKEPLCRIAGQSGASLILYSSCNPSTFDRDLGHLINAGFEISSVALFDFFPRTPHVEIVALLKRIGNRTT